jgi:hypothetical protein
LFSRFVAFYLIPFYLLKKAVPVGGLLGCLNTVSGNTTKNENSKVKVKVTNSSKRTFIE